MTFYTVQCAYAAYYSNTVTVEADNLITAKLKENKAALATVAAESKTWCPGWMAFPATGQ